ncbi:MAG: UDP-N-acetylmuramoyl-L-alanine--D-glutamate ligase, partial [Campylobacterales bacterium]|nr:UDP-N-acetylmuramoyl-L-alanine--D-glutamate ligase [Campylobacterales bacterium]
MTLFGYGKTTGAIAKKFGNCKIYDDKFNEINEFGTNVMMPMIEFDETKSILEVPSPGIPPTHPMVRRAKNLISEYDLFADTMPYSIWISGTNGKTTVTGMIQKLLEKRGSMCGGNVGTPLAEMDEKANIWILETSSFTLHYTNKAKPNLYVLLPITPDHVQWHGSFEEYEKSKLKPIQALKEGEMAIVPEKYKDTSTNGFLVTYKSEEDLCEYFGIEKEKVEFKNPFLIDAIIALGVSKALFNEIDYDLINSYQVDPHKLEEFKDKKNRLWIDDSKATNLDATLQALKTYENKDIHLILGGDDKGADLTELFEKLKTIKPTVYSIGKNASKIFDFCEKEEIPAKLCGFIEVAVSKIDENLEENSVGILSP